MDSEIKEIPFWNKYLLTIAEAAQYFSIGEKKLRKLVDNGDSDFALKNGSKIKITMNVYNHADLERISSEFNRVESALLLG